jgi:hypothetical protein
MVFAFRGAGYFIVRTPDGIIHQMSLVGTVEDLKWSMSEKLRVPISRLVLVADGCTLNDGKTEIVI